MAPWPLPALPALLQPVAHALLQAQEEVQELLSDFPTELLWIQPAGCASVGFHLQHLTGVLDRLFTYARGEALHPAQMDWLKAEGKPVDDLTSEDLLSVFDRQIQKSLTYLSTVNEETLTQHRPVGRAALPSNVIGLLVHAAEHTMRHLGQLLVTVKVVRATTPTQSPVDLPAA